MKSRYLTSIKTKSGRVTTFEDNISSTPSFWLSQAKKDKKANIDTKLGITTQNGKQIVSSVRSEFPNGDVFVASYLGNKKSNKSVRPGKASRR